MSLKFKFNNQIQLDMYSILSTLTINNATKLQFDSKQSSTISNTHLLFVDMKKVPNNFSFSFNSDDNIYFLFDENFNCQYVGKKGTSDGINYRLGLHLLKNTTTISSAIESICNYLNDTKTSQKIIYVITYKIEPSYMSEGVESYFIDYFRNKGHAKWVRRK